MKGSTPSKRCVATGGEGGPGDSGNSGDTTNGNGGKGGNTEINGVAVGVMVAQLISIATALVNSLSILECNSNIEKLIKILIRPPMMSSVESLRGVVRRLEAR